jgi:hypothetical protein
MRYASFLTLIKICFLTLLVIGAFQTYAYISGWETQTQTGTSTKNQDVFASAKVQNLGSVSVAITTALGSVSSNTAGNESVSNLIFTGPESVGNSELQRNTQRREMIEVNMNIIREYLGIAKTDIVDALLQSPQRKNTLESLISQLEIRYKNAALSSKSLSEYQAKLSANMQQVQSQIDSFKQKMNGDFSAFDSKASSDDVEAYLELKKEYQSNYVDIIYINQFLKQYSFLNDYSKKLLDTLINNKEALITQSFVVIPSSGDEFLKTFNLIYDEDEYKIKQESTEVQ